jgi:hypothetical protein
MLIVVPALQAQTIGYAVNSDDRDDLLRLTLETGRADVIAGAAEGTSTGAGGTEAVGGGYLDIEGLAFAPDGRLFGIDDATKTLVILNTTTGLASSVGQSRPGNTNLATGAGPEFAQDFGLSFACDGTLFASSDTKRNLYRVDTTTGAATRIGGEGALGAQITGLAVRGEQIYGLGSTGDEGLYSIDRNSGRATLIGRLGAGLSFTDGDLAFAADGTLWGVADRSDVGANGEPSILFKVHPLTGAATRVSTTALGIESLAIAPPVCSSLQLLGPAPAAVSVNSVWALSLLGLLLGVIGAFAVPRNARG